MMSKLPISLLILRTIYEWRLWVVLPLTLAWLVYAAYLLLHHRKWFFVWLLVFPIFIGPLDIAATYCGWHYRMGLRQRYATVSPTDKTYSINRMPPDILQEYARHDYHPRLRDIKAKVLGNTLLLCLFCAIGLFLWLCRRKMLSQKQ